MVADDHQQELILIGVDNSFFIRTRASRAYETQLRAIRLYCQSKLECNTKKNATAAIALYSMGGKGDYVYYLQPTSDVDKIMAACTVGTGVGMLYTGDLNLRRGISMSLALLNHLPHPLVDKAHKRCLFLIGGPTGLPFDLAVSLGERAKRLRIAVDVVNFCPDDRTRLFLEGFVSAANHKGNCHIKHIQAESYLRHVAQVLSSSGEIIPRASMEHAIIASEKQIAKEEAERIRIRERMKPKGGENPSPSIGMKQLDGLSSFDHNRFHKGKMTF